MLFLSSLHTLNLDTWFGSTFFKEFHKGLAQLVQCLLKKVGPSEALFVSPKRGDSLDKFLEEIKDTGLHFSVTAKYDAEIWRRHQSFMNGDDSWPSYEKDHCYPLLVRITRWTFGFHSPNHLHIFPAIPYSTNRKNFYVTCLPFHIMHVSNGSHHEKFYHEHHESVCVKVFEFHQSKIIILW